MTTENLPDWQPGKYGGTLRLAHAVANWNPDVFVMMDEPFLMAPKIGDQDIVCNVCKEFKVSGRQQGLHLHPAQGPEVVGRRAGDYRGRALRL